MNLPAPLARAVERWPALTITALVAGFAAAAAVGSGAAVARPVPKTPKNITLDVGYIGTNGLFTGPEGFAYSRGLLQKWLKPAGVTSIQTAGFANGPLQTAALVGGSVNLGLLGDTPGLIAYSQGTSDRLINQYGVNNEAWIVARPGITSLSQLVGKTVAVQPESYMDRYLQGLLAQQGLTGKVDRVAMLLTAAIPAVEAGSIDAVVVPPTEALPLTGQGYPVVIKSATTPKLQGTGLTVASTSLLSADPGIVKAWNAARDKAIAYAKAHASAYYAYAATTQTGATAAQEREFSPLSDYPTKPFTTSGLTQLQGTLNFLVAQGDATAFSIKSWEAKGS
ncbi:MAG: ABC transporter substrate-binding protein [Solirubrobacteraceae bacterium]|jgi:ABC-type taurine transport system substrate-binding protein